MTDVESKPINFVMAYYEYETDVKTQIIRFFILSVKLVSSELVYEVHNLTGFTSFLVDIFVSHTAFIALLRINIPFQISGDNIDLQ